MRKDKLKSILDKLEKEYPEADCALEYSSVFQLLIAVTLSAQTTDKSVNIVTKELFRKYGDANKLSKAEVYEIEGIIKRIGLYKNKARNICNIAKIIDVEYDGVVPNDYDKLVLLPGVGRKTANVILSIGFGVPRIAVDTHVFRVSNRIGIVNENSVLKTELALMRVIPEERWSKTHHSLIFHGRNCCHSRKPNCEGCIISKECKKVIKKS